MTRRLFSCFGRGSSSKHEICSHENATAVLPDEEQKTGGPVLVELFSSQGCAASLEAELLFSRVGRGDFNLEVPVILLAYHVDYWDYMGWKDPFGQSQWTVRQKAYVEALNLDTIFTPQIVVQGQAQCIGNDQDALLSCITSTPRVPALSFQASFERLPTEWLQVSLTGGLKTKVEYEIMVVLYESGLVSRCSDGANKDRVIANDFVVRRLEKLRSISSKKAHLGTVNFPLWEGFNSAKCGVAILLETASHHILASQNFQLPTNL